MNTAKTLRRSPLENTLLLHPLFLFSLFLLLLNDFYLKYEYHNGFTGKLSDFAGLFAFFIFFRSIFPSHRKTILIGVSLFFIWWKSPLSSPFIDFTNSVLHIPVSRVIDYTDYIALAILPLAYYLQSIHYSPSFCRKAAIGSIGLVSFFAFTATSLPRLITDEGRIPLNKKIRTTKNEHEIIQRLQKNGLQLQEDSAFERAYLYDGRPYLRTKSTEGETIFIPVSPKYDGVFTKVVGSVYTISELRIGSDTVQDVQIVINEVNNKRYDITILNFRHGSKEDALSVDAYYLRKRLKKPIKKRFKEIIKNK